MAMIMPTTNTLEIAASDILRLIQAHLIEAGLNGTVKALQQESGVGLAGQFVCNYQFHASSGQWGAVLQSLAWLDHERARLPAELLAETHEMAILELAEAGDLSLAYATYRVVQKQLEASTVVQNDDNSSSQVVSRARVLEQKLAALAAASTTTDKTKKTPTSTILPKDFYGPNNVTRQERRDDIGRRLQEAVPIMPKHRLTTLLQQAIQWQIYTGQIPRIRRQWWGQEEEEDDENENSEKPDPTLNNNNDANNNKNSKKKKKKKRKRKDFDLVLGEALVDEIPVGTALTELPPTEPIPTAPFATIKFGKKATPEAAVFLPNGSGLVTGSSDGLIELWDASHNYNQLLPLPYQQREELLGHDGDDSSGVAVAVTALAVSNDGEMLVSASSDGHVKVWRIDTGKCLRAWQAHTQRISCLALAPDASHVLTGSQDGLCREFGMRTSRVLKEFGHHGTYITTCDYHANVVLGDDRVLVVTGSGDGMVRIWDRSSQDILRVLRPVSIGVSSLTSVGSSMVADAAFSQASSDQVLVAGSPAIYAILPLHTPPSTMIVVPRGYRAFLVDYTGSVLRVFLDDNDIGAAADKKVFVAATVSTTNQWLYAVKEDGVCCVFNVETASLETSIRDFGSETMRVPKDANPSAAMAELSTLLHHPNKSILAAFSSNKSQKKGQVVLWK